MASGKLFLADCGSLPFVFLFLQTMNFILKAIHHFAYEVMVPRLANNPTFQRFVVETNSTAKQAQEKLTQAASQQATQNVWAYRAMNLRKDAEKKFQSFRNELDNEILEEYNKSQKLNSGNKRVQPRQKTDYERRHGRR